jgi:hypothetical protein
MLAEHRLHPATSSGRCSSAKGRAARSRSPRFPGQPLVGRPACRPGARGGPARHSVRRLVPQHAPICAPMTREKRSTPTTSSAARSRRSRIRCRRSASSPTSRSTPIPPRPRRPHRRSRLRRQRRDREDACRAGAGPGRRRRRHRRAVGHDGRPCRRDPRRRSSARPLRRLDHGLCRQICVGFLWPVPRGGRQPGPPERRQARPIRWTLPTGKRRFAKSRSTSPRAPTW